MVNASGANGYDNGNVPSDDQLREALLQYARERLPHERRLARLQEELGYKIGKTKLKELHNKFDIPVVRKPPDRAMVSALVTEKMAEDTNRLNGPNTIMHELALEGRIVPRDTVRRIMRTEDPAGAALRRPTARIKVHRKTLTGLGVFHEVSCDGHEKFSSLALDMGPVGIPVYGMRDKWTGKVLHLVVVPNARKSGVIGHVYLDFTEKYKSIPVQITVDHGSETGEMYAMQTSLRKNYAPDLNSNEWPPFVALRSVHNINIENIWQRLRKHSGKNIAEVLIQGKIRGLFNPNCIVHVNLFHWLWPPIVQEGLDRFTEYWNTHRVRYQPKKDMPSGGTPNDFFARPADYGGQRLNIPIDPEVITDLRTRLPLTREEAFRWVEDEFAAAAVEVWHEIGAPPLTLQSGWDVFGQMSPRLLLMYDDSI